MEKDYLFYAHESLDRSHLLRSDSEQVEKHFNHQNARFIGHWRSKNFFFTENGEPRAFQLQKADFIEVTRIDSFFLGLHKNEPVFGVDFSDLEQSEVSALIPGGTIEDLRAHAGNLNNDDASLLAYVRAMFIWHKNHAYCGKCGARTLSKSSGHERKCSNDICNTVAFPRIDPAVIVLIQHRFEDGVNRCLLGRHKRSRPGMYSTLAGFVEPGESLEMTVKREMFEEAGIEVDNIRYVASQPWPFPSSIMLGFYADALNAELQLDLDEITEANWFSAQDLKERSEAGEITLSGVDSIARHLILNWMKGEGF